MQLNEHAGRVRRVRAIPVLEMAMPDLPKPTDRAMQWAEANKQALHFMLGAQRMMLEEVAFAADAMLDRVRTETHLAGEFAARLAEAHSVRDLNAMARECSEHQLEFVRRECDRMLRHGERLIEATSSLLNNGHSVARLEPPGMADRTASGEGGDQQYQPDQARQP